MLRLTFFSLMSQAAIGALVPMSFMSVAETGRLFFRFVSGLAIVLLVLAVWAQPFGSSASRVFSAASGSMAGMILLLLACSMVLLVLMNLFMPGWTKTFLWMAIVAGFVASAQVAAVFPDAATVARPRHWVNATSFASSTLLVGSALGAMITGHWYLVNRRLSTQPLRVASRVLLTAGVLRCVVVAAVLAALGWGGEPTQAEAVRHLFTLSGEGLFFGARLVVGLIAPCVFGYMIREAVKLHSMQSATGMLYATVIFVILGEVFSKFIFYFMNLPV